MGKILIVEDEVIIRGFIVRMVRNIDVSLEVYETGAAKEALLIAKENVIDVFILDIQLEDYSGLELALQIREIEGYQLTPIIFISGAISKEFEAYRQIHCYSFLEKPFNEKDIKKLLETVLEHGIKKVEDKLLKIVLKNKNATYVLKEKDILYIERKNRTLIIYTINEVINYSLSSLATILKQLSDDFVQCHQGFLINKSFITKIDHVEHVIYLESIDYTIPIGRKYRSNFIYSDYYL